MEGLPYELVMNVLSLVDPLRDTAAICGTSRAWRQCMYDPQLWRAFHQRTFPSVFGPDDMPDNVREVLARRQVAVPDEDKPWRPLFEKGARRLKELLASVESTPHQQQEHQGWDWRMLAAAEVGCLPLVKYYAERLVDLRFPPANTTTNAASDSKDPGAAEKASPIASCDMTRLKLLATLTISSQPDKLLINRGLLCAINSAPTAKFFVDLGASIPKIESSVTAMGNLHVAALLLAHGANVSWFALPRAAHEGHLGMVQLLLECITNAEAQAAMVEAICNNHLPIVRALIEGGYVPSNGAVMAALRRTTYQIPRDSYLEMLRLLVPGLAPPLDSSTSFHLFTSLLLERTGDVDICRLLVAHGADINVLHQMNLAMVTPLHHAIKEDNSKLVQCFLACGARTDIKAHYHSSSVTSLSLARQFRPTMVELLVKHERARRAPKNDSSTANGVSPSARGRKKRKSEEAEEDKDQNADQEKPKNPSKKQKVQPVSEQKQREKELEDLVRRLAKIPYEAKLDVFALRQLLKKSGVQAREMPKRKIDLLESAAQWLLNGSARPSLLD